MLWDRFRWHVQLRKANKSTRSRGKPLQVSTFVLIRGEKYLISLIVEDNAYITPYHCCLHEIYNKYIYIFHIYIIFFIKDLTANLLYPERCRLKKFYDAVNLHEKTDLIWNVSFIISVYLFDIKSRCFSFVPRIVINYSPHEQASHY